MDYKPVGGVRSVTLYAADTVGGVLAEVELIDDSSTYKEVLAAEKGCGVVRQTLTLKALYSSAAAWLSSEFIEEATLAGVVAKVTLNDLRQITVGYSEAMKLEQPLRLKSLEIDSKHSVEQTPTVTLELCCESITLT